MMVKFEALVSALGVDGRIDLVKHVLGEASSSNQSKMCELIMDSLHLDFRDILSNTETARLNRFNRTSESS